MKRFFTVFFAVLMAVAGSVVYAEVISQEVAKQTADNFLSLDSDWKGAGDATIRLVESDGMPAYYVVEYTQGGWAIVSAQSSASPVIGYNPTGAYGAPAPMQALLDANAKSIVQEARREASIEHEGWKRVMQRKPAANPSEVPDVAPLIKMDLNQTEPYNDMCPKINGQRCLVGCVAVGMAQAMMTQRYPIAPKGKHTYSCDGIGQLSIDYDKEAPYNWDAMFDNDFKEVARLLYHCGVSVNMGYGVDGSGAGDSPVPTALVKYFSYDDNFIELIDKPSNGEGWLERMLDEIQLGRVIIYFGSNETSGHCWNLDGWKKSTQMVHVNWGWGGYGNAYFDINAMEDKFQDMSFPYYNSAVVGVGTPTTAPYGIKLSTDKFVIGTAAGVALADVIVSCEDPEANFSYEILGPKNIMGKHTVSPYSVQDGKLVASEAVQDVNKFKYMLMTVTNTNTGESFTK
ncbi:MAG: C10 family peptidase, partial [Bacteroidaceae bacterium]|nr:C10 family peptidase [Bacteroidaceae bacterium]